ncbi:MAG: chorismate-binding protein [Solirubrobacteraceae bacterium]
MRVARTIAGTATLTRTPLRCALAPADVLARLRDEPLPFALVGDWAGGGAIVGADPACVADPSEDPFALLDLVPAVAGGPSAAAYGRAAVAGGASAAAAGGVGGGWFGWLGYRLAALVERVPLAPRCPVALPDFHLAYYDHVLRLDLDGRWWFEALATDTRREALDRRLARIRDLLKRDSPPPPAAPGPLTLSAADAAHHLAAVADCRARIAAGEIFQANLCLRLDAPCNARPTELLGVALGRVRPRYAAAFHTPHGGIVSLSPELFLRRRGREVVTGPIKGTIARDGTPASEAAALRALTGSSKDAAEHVMIVDLMRNDLGRVCEYGTVTAPASPTPEAHPGVWHLVSDVRGRLRADASDEQLLRATFPPGSVTGAPKVQSLRVIAALEPTCREVYTGAIGFAGPIAGLELSVAIRTVELAAGRLWLGAGGGIVADSDPNVELAEALAKARPIAGAIGTTVHVQDGVVGAAA